MLDYSADQTLAEPIRDDSPLWWTIPFRQAVAFPDFDGLSPFVLFAVIYALVWLLMLINPFIGLRAVWDERGGIRARATYAAAAAPQLC